jgi:hypothetical protein
MNNAEGRPAPSYDKRIQSEAPHNSRESPVAHNMVTGNKGEYAFGKLWSTCAISRCCVPDSVSMEPFAPIAKLGGLENSFYKSSGGC